MNGFNRFVNLTAMLIMSIQLTAQVTITVPNPSFERTIGWGNGSVQGANYNYWQWYRCNPQGTADMMAGDGLWGVNKPAQHLGYYGFMLATFPDTNQFESIAADLSTPFVPCNTYQFTIYLSNMKRGSGACALNGNSYEHNYWDIELELYGTNSCGFEELLWESGNIDHCDWQQYTVTFSPSAAYSQIHWRPKMVDIYALGLPIGWHRMFGVGVDNMSSIVPLNASVPLETFDVQLCAGDSVFAAGAYQTLSGIYNDTLQTVAGCDSIISTIVNVLPAFNSNTTVNICAGDSALIGGAYQTIAGVYSDTLQSVGSCDSIINVTLNVSAAYNSNATVNVCAGDSVLIGGVYQTIAGIYNDTLQSISGCDSIISTTLNVLPAYLAITSMDICDGDSVFLGGAYQTIAGTYHDTIQLAGSCDSVTITTLNFLSAFINNVTVDLCAGDSLFVAGAYQTQAGIYYDTVQSLSSCDSVTITTLNFLSVFTNNLSVDLCAGDSLFVAGAYQTQAGIYYDTVQSLSSCDSVTITTLSLLSPFIYNMSLIICEGDSVFLEGNYQTQAGTYYDTLQSTNSCDSIVVTVLSTSLNGNASIELVPVLCESDIPINLSAASAGGEWSGYGIINSINGTFDPGVVGVGIWTVTYTIDGPCGDSQSTTIEVLPESNLSIDLVSEYCPDDPGFYLSAHPSGGYWAGPGIDEYTGFFSVQDAGQGTHVITYDMDGECVDNASVDVIVLESCPEPVELIYYVPNSFTPDGDSYNQIFQPVFSSGFDPFDFHMMIFNRWGEVIFESHNAEVGWDGTYANKIVQGGTYIWRIEFKQLDVDNRVELMGHVNLLR
ncbi:MAG: gliding motility-associated C-terminal domain-containing protein [Crocinitomicaceae bacterium]|nr:gliding motility-associated C-terminal domain-containing protein [Crocinitomicaceae bacterium]